MGRGAGDDEGGAGVHDVPAALARIRADVQVVLGARAWSLSAGQLRDAVVDASAAVASLEAGRLALLKALDDRDGAVAGASAGRAGETFGVHRLRLEPAQARRDVAAAHALDRGSGALPRVGAALAAGQITRAHADVCVRVAADLPRRLAHRLDPVSGRSGLELADEFLAEHARAQSPGTMRWLGEQLLARIAPERAERFDPDAHLRRSLTLRTDSTGMTIGHFAMEAADAVMLRAALTRGDRSPAQRRYDAFTAITRHGTTCGQDDAPSVPAVVFLTADTDQVDAAVLARFICQVTLRRVLLAPTEQSSTSAAPYAWPPPAKSTP